jgi:phosphoribosylaminoimidazole-succinocarboxamide synthase
MQPPIVLATTIPGLKRHATGKVRDIYDLGDALLLVATDRISAFDVVLHQGIPDKGRVLTRLSAYWFENTRDIVDNHLLTADDDAVAARLHQAGVSVTDELRATLAGRAMLCVKTTPLPIEAVVRGCLSGSAWKEYKAQSATGGSLVDLWGVPLPAGLRESDRLPQPVFTPSTKATAGHDIPLHRDDIAKTIGPEFAPQVEETSLRLYQAAAERAAAQGILIADTKFEFGTVPGAGGTGFRLMLIDEALTPDSSRFWDAATYEPGKPQPSFDKQFVRDFLESVPGWDKQPPAPDLPDEIVAKTAEKYRDACRRITGDDLPPLPPSLGGRGGVIGGGHIA